MPFDRLPSLGTFSYNGITANETLKSKISGRMVYDEAGRTVKGVEYTIDVEFYLASLEAGENTDGQMTGVWRQLSKPGGKLLMSSRGHGELNVNVGDVWDSDWGPKPRVVSWRPTGEANGAFVTWQCTTTIPAAENPKYKGLSSWNSEVEDTSDEAGWTTRRISGYIEIAQTRKAVDNVNVPRTADEFREKFMPAIPLGFKPINQSWRTNKSRNRADYSVTMQEVPYPLPAGLPVCDIDDSIEGSISTGFVNWNRVVSGYVRTSPGDAQAVRVAQGVAHPAVVHAHQGVAEVGRSTQADPPR